jgi:hypothetical protein
MKLIDLFHQDVPGLPGKDDESPLFAEEFFEDAQLLDVRIYALHSVVGILFELRTGNLPWYVDDKSINCGVLMLRRATAVAWQGELTDWTGPTPWPVFSVLSNIHNGRYELSLEMGVFKNMTLQLAALKAVIGPPLAVQRLCDS